MSKTVDRMPWTANKVDNGWYALLCILNGPHNQEENSEAKKLFHHMCWRSLIECRLQSVSLFGCVMSFCSDVFSNWWRCLWIDSVFLILSVMNSLSYHTCPQELLYPIRTCSNTERHSIQHNDKHGISLLHIKNILCLCIHFLLSSSSGMLAS